MKDPYSRVAFVAVGDRKFDEMVDLGKHILWNKDTGIPLKGAHYGWDLSAYEEKGINIRNLLKQEMDVSTNTKDGADKNKHKLKGRELIALDVGHWGAFDYEREKTDKPQRDFGMIENYNVFLCRFNNKGKIPGTVEHLRKCGCKNAALLVEELEKNIEGCVHGVELVNKAPIEDRKFCKGMKKEQLYIIIPDLHLPESWPDLPEAGERYGGPNPDKEAISVRERLFIHLFCCQHEPGAWTGNPLTKGDLSYLQSYLDWLKKKENQAGIDWPWEVKYRGRSTMLTSKQFLAEKKLLDRFLKCRSTWFYPKYDKNLLDANPQPAIDLINFLSSVKKVQDATRKVSVIQVGDMYELWLDREYLYRYFKTLPGESAGSPKAVKLAARSGVEDFQYRMDRDWKDEKKTIHPAKRYVFNPWPDNETCFRHAQGRDGFLKLQGQEKEKQETMKHLRELLADRINNICNFSLSMPDDNNKSFKRLKHELKDFNWYIRTIMKAEYEPGLPHWKNIWSKKEVYWNKIIIDLFKSLNYQSLYGNHDGYRGDPLLNPGISVEHRCIEGWISEPGIWFEHGHRWDEYNRDGFAFGAAVTNYVFHYRNSLAQGIVYSLKSFVLAERWGSLLPGGALWYALVNYPGEFKNIVGKKVPGNIHNFGVYVFGHTHEPDLVRLQFIPTASEYWAEIKRQQLKKVERTINQIKNVPYQIYQEMRSQAFRPWIY